MTELRNAQADRSRFRARVLVLAVAILLAFGLLVARLVYLQVVRHDVLSERAESNRTAVVPIVPNRGLILDRNGVVLATNYSAYTLEVTPSQSGPIEEVIDALSEIVDIQPRDRRRFRQLMREARNFESLPLRTRLSSEEVARFSAQRYRFPGVDINARLFRTYPYGELASHVVGYIGRINKADKERIQNSDDEDEEANYRGTEYIGKVGIERSYESQLHGTTGVEQMETVASGNAVRRLSSSPATPGQTIQLSLDIALQKLVEDMFGERRGALVAIDPRTGEVLALVSKPTFDPNLFVEGIDSESWAALNESIDKPLINRALRGTYPPGSTYKPFMALAGLESGKRAANTLVNDPGYFNFAGRRFGSPEGYLGDLDMRRSIQLSSNIYYYTLANEMGVDLIHDFMKPLSFGQITGIDLGGEVSGILPSIAWKREYNKNRRPEQQKWYAGETISLGIGQGYNEFTMLQLAQATAIIANGGIKHRPHLVLGTRDSVTGQVTPETQPPAENLGYRAANVNVIHEGLVSVITGGTGRGVFAGAGYQAAGKTGTAQAQSQAKNTKYNPRMLEEHQRDHSLFMGYAPADNPRIALAVIVENAGWGAAVATPIARRVFDYWLLQQYPNPEDMAAVKIGRATARIGKPLNAADIALPTTQ